MNLLFGHSPINPFQSGSLGTGALAISRDGKILESKKEYETDYKQIKIYVGLLNDLASLFGLAIIIYSGYSSVDSNSKTQESSNTQSLNWSAIGSAIGGIFPWFIMFTISQMINHWRIHKVQTILENYQHERQNLTSSIHWTLLTRYQIFCQLAIQDIFTDQKLAHEVALRWIAEKVSSHFDENAKKALNDTGAVLSTTISFLKNRTLYSRLYMDVLPMFLLLLFMVIGGFLGQLTKPDQSVVIVQICALILLGLMAVLARFVPAASQFLSRRDLDKTINALEMVGLVENSARMLFNDLKESLSQADYSQIDQILTDNLSSPAYQVNIIPDDQILSKRATYSLQSNTRVVIKNSASIFELSRFAAAFQ